MKRYYIPIITIFIILLCAGPLLGGTSYINDPKTLINTSPNPNYEAPYKLIYHGNNNELFNAGLDEQLDLIYQLKWDGVGNGRDDPDAVPEPATFFFLF